MGVHGLTSFLNQYPSLGRTVVLTPPSPGTAPTPVIVDLLSFAYAIGVREPTRGGQYEEVEQLLTGIVKHWRACGLSPEFVVDGEFEMGQGTLICPSPFPRARAAC